MAQSSYQKVIIFQVEKPGAVLVIHEIIYSMMCLRI